MKLSYKRYIIEGMLIVFSVLFALLINKTFEDYRTNQRKAIAKESINKELHTNQSIINRWRTKHCEIKNRINCVIEGKADSLKTELKKYNYLNLGILTSNKPLLDVILTNTAWESTKATGIITEFDFETIQKLTLVYDLQKIVMDRTAMGILDYVFDSESNNIENLDRTLVQLHLRFQELTGQEETILSLYEDAIHKLDN